jgi:2-amino-4-hydroxy-6-hydroxymethyldihydropteridine diphosphokinase
VDRIYVGLGSNLGDRRAWIEEAVDRMGLAGIRALKRSGLYETEPYKLMDQPPFLNLVVLCGTELKPRPLLERCLAIEREMGRERRERYGPRVIDLDILLYGNRVVDEPDLKIPHHDLENRFFVLVPLYDLDPKLRHPVSKKTVRELLAELETRTGRGGRVLRQVEPPGEG